MSRHSLTVILCTHEPRMDYLRRVLLALRHQKLALDRWELILIDNASSDPLAARIDLSWHPNGRIVVEPRLGLTHARFRGARESSTDLLVFIDDDNVASVDYLENALGIFDANPSIGCVSGDISAEYEKQPPSWFRGELESWLAVRRIEKDRFSNFWHPRSEPCGAGMVVRRSIVRSLERPVATTNGGIVLGRRGESLMSGEDVEISHRAMEMGFLVGQVSSLKLVHLIPARKASEEYLFALYSYILASGQVIAWKRSGFSPLRSFFLSLPKEVAKIVLRHRPERRMAFARIQSHFLAWKAIRNLSSSTSP